MRALLLDLDDTLLQTDMEVFLPAYLNRLAAELDGYGPAEELIAKLSEATRAMIADLDPTRTLKQTFDAHFYPSIGTTEADLRPTVERFYSEIYPELRALTEPAAGAADLVAAAADAGLEIVIATNPLFPRTALDQRVEWAGFQPEQGAFRFITAYEDFHFAKPQPEYFAEILGLLGIEPRLAAAIGDDAQNDIAPARMLGMRTFHCAESSAQEGPSGDMAEARAWLADLLHDDRGAAASPTRPARAVLARLRGQLAALLQRTRGMDSTWIERPSARERAPAETVGYLRDMELDVLQPALESLLTQDAPFLPAPDSPGWADERSYLKQDPRAALEAYVGAREETLGRLSALSEQDWERPARHALFGPVTLTSWLDRSADHEVRQLAHLRRLLESE